MATLKQVLNAANPIDLPDAIKQVGLGTIIQGLLTLVTETVSSVTDDRVVLTYRPVGVPLLVQVGTSVKAEMMGTVATGKYTYAPSTKTVQLYASEGGATTYIRYFTLEAAVASATLSIDSTSTLATALATEFPATPTR